MKKSLLLGLGTVLLCCFTLVHAKAVKKPLVHEYTLKNGLKLIVKENHRAPAVISQVWYKIGSGYEPSGITGVSHVLEHMMFKGTKQYPAGRFSKLIAENGGQENAFTSKDYTAYFQKLPADKYALSLRLEADRMKNLILTQKEFAKEIEVVKEERRMRTDDNPQVLTYERFLAAAHLAHPYHHMTIGWMNDLQNMTIKDLKSWYQRWYSPNNAVIVVTGDVNPEKVYQATKRYFENIPKKSLPTIKPQQEPPALGTRHVIVERPAKLPLLLMGYNTPSVITAKTSWHPYALEVLAAILDSSHSARLSKELVRGRQLATELGVSYDLFSRFSGLFLLEGIPSQGHTTDELQLALLQQIQRVQNELVSDKELARVKTQVVAENIYKQDSLFGQAMELGALESVGLSWKLGEDYVKHIQAVTAQQVQEVARKYLTPTRLTIAELKPQPLSGAHHEK